MNLIKHIFLLGLLIVSTSHVTAGQDDLLPPDQAFSLQAWVEGDMIRAEYTIAPGYYMYRDAFRFEVETEGATFDEPSVPDGKIKHDEFFGDVEVYRNKVTIGLPLLFSGAQTPDRVNIKTTGQGCADIGVCYPPLYQSLNMVLASSKRVDPTPYILQAANKVQTAKNNDVEALQKLFDQASNNTMSSQTPQPAPVDNTELASSGDVLDPVALLQSLGDDIGFDEEDEIPDPDTAFKLGATLDKNNIIQSEIQLYQHTYLYRDKMKVNLVDGTGHELGVISLPAGDEKDDEFFGLMQVYHDYVKVSIPVISGANASAQYVLAYGYQGCVEDKICYPPITKYFKVDLTDGSVLISDEPPVIASSHLLAAGDPAQNLALTESRDSSGLATTEQDHFAGLLTNASLWSIFLFFLAGVGLTFTPCVFPMIPILSGIIAGQGENITTRKAFTLSLVYVLAMASTYAVAGAIVGRFGAEFNIQVWFQDPVILSIFAGIFVLLSLSMFGFYDLQMPGFIQSRLTEISNKQEGGSLLGVGLMGLFSALIVGPCITAPLVGALIFISQTQDWQLGGLALFALGLGMGTPLLLLGTTAGKLLPRAGGWMDVIKAIFGVGLLAVAVWLLERILPTSITMLLMAALIIVSSIYMGALDKLAEGASGWKKLWKGIGLIFLLYGVFYLYGVAAGSKDLIQPLKGITGSVFKGSSGGELLSENHINFKQIKGELGLKQALAASPGKPAMLDFYADWCISCKEMEKYAFTHPDVLTALKNVETLQTDVTANDKTDQLFMKSLGIYGPPAILFFDEQGKEIENSRVVGEMSGEQFAAHIKTIMNSVKP